MFCGRTGGMIMSEQQGQHERRQADSKPGRGDSAPRTAISASAAGVAGVAGGVPPAPGPKKKPRPSGLPVRSLAYPEPVERMIAEFASLPGIGPRAAERMALHILRAPPQAASELASAVLAMRQQIGHCARCFNLAAKGTVTGVAVALGEGEAAVLCGVCAEPSRDDQQMLVVEQPRDVLALEQLKLYNGLYHVLLGRLSPLDGIGPESLTLGFMMDRLAAAAGAGRPVREVILGLSPTLEGDATMLYIGEMLEPLGVHISRLSRGLPAGQALEYANKTALADALEGRRRV